MVKPTNGELKKHTEFKEIGRELGISIEAVKCKKALAADKQIKFAGIFSPKGKMLAAQYASEENPAFVDTEYEFSATHAAIHALQKNMEGTKVGQMYYSFAAYEYIKRATFLLEDDNYLLVSFDRQADEHDIIKKVIYEVGLGY